VSVLGRKLWRELRQLRGQVVALSLVVVAGIAMMTMALSNYQALSESRTQYYAQYRFADVFAQARRVPLPMLEEVRAIPGVRQAQARAVGFASLELERFPEPVNAQLVSLPRPGDPGLNGVHLLNGQLPAADDEVLLEQAFATAHGFVPGDRLVAVLNGRRQALRVTGVAMSPEFIYAIRPGDIFPDFQRFGVLWMPHAPLAQAFDLDGAFNDLVVVLDHDARQDDVVQALDRLLLPWGARGAHGRDLQVSDRFVSEELDQLLVMTRLFTGVFLLVAAFLLNIVAGRVVGSQREVIALLKAFGYTRARVAGHYAGLVLLMVGAGVLPGLLLGAWGGRALSRVYQVFFSLPELHWSLSPSIGLLAVGFAVCAGALGTASALLRAFRLPPAEAMRPEAPASFRATLAERLGLARWMDPGARMILRNLERRPLRTAMSVLGIGLACGIMVMSRFQSAAIEEMVEVQFNFASREDLAVAFVEPTSWRAAAELASLPGVVAVEPFRVADVVLRNGHREYRIALQGLGPDNDLRRVLDREQRPVAVPGSGLMLTDYLADLLDLRPGDRVEVDFREGHRETVEVVLAGVVSEYLGVGAYLGIDALNRLLRQDASLSGAWLDVADGQRQATLDALRERPRVATVSDRSAMVEGFRQTMAEGVLVFALVATVLAGSIAVGVVYNAARITLAERSRELASLRVLGYTRAEVRRLLGGELMSLAMLALLPGFALGYGMSALLVWGMRSDLYRIPLVFGPQAYAVAGLLVLGATLCSSLLVRRRLDAIDLVAALKTKE